MEKQVRSTLDAAKALALHDAQSAVAREYGCPSWNALREEVESRVLSFDSAIDEHAIIASCCES